MSRGNLFVFLAKEPGQLKNPDDSLLLESRNNRPSFGVSLA